MKNKIEFTLLSLILVCLAQSAIARTFVIKKLNTPFINIGGVNKVVGDSYSDTDTIFWSNDNQAMRVLSDDNQTYTVSKNLASKLHASNMENLFFSQRTAAVRDLGEETVQYHKALFENEFVLLDTLSFKTGWENGESYFEGTITCPWTTESTFRFPAEGKRVYLSRELLTTHAPGAENLVLTVRYVEPPYNDFELLTDSMKIEIVPGQLK